MSSLKYRRVPWSDKEEWMEVYRLIQGGRILSAYTAAVCYIETWIKSGFCPPAVEYTCRFLQCIVRDNHFFQLENPENVENLQAQYATALLRFVNILGEMESLKSLSLNARALKLGLPEWVVQTRNQISLGSELPSLDVLRVSVDALLNWLMVNYWEVEKVAMNDVVISAKECLLEGNMIGLFNIYTFLYDVKTEFHSVRDIENLSIKKRIAHLDDLMFHSFKNQTSPWKPHFVPAHSFVMVPKKLMRLSIHKATIYVSRALRVYFDTETEAALPIFVKILLNETKMRGLIPELWEPFFVWLHSKGSYPSLILHIFDELTRETPEFYDQAEEWCIFLLNCLEKRRKVDGKIRKLSAQAVSEPISKKMKLNLTEKQQKSLIKKKVKQQLSSETDDSKNDIVTNAFNIIERQCPALKCTYRLKSGHYPSETDYLSMMTKLFLSSRDPPSEISRLVQGLSTTMTKEKMSNVQQLALLKRDRPLNVDTRAVSQIYDCHMLDRYIR